MGVLFPVKNVLLNRRGGRATASTTVLVKQKPPTKKSTGFVLHHWMFRTAVTQHNITLITTNTCCSSGIYSVDGQQYFQMLLETFCCLGVPKASVV